MLEDKNKQTNKQSIKKTRLGSTKKKKKHNTLKPFFGSTKKKKKIPRTQLNYFLLSMGYRLFFNIVYPGEKVSR